MKGVLSESGERTEGGCSHQSGGSYSVRFSRGFSRDFTVVVGID